MNSKQLRKYRKNFYVNLENFIKENNSLTMDDYHFIIEKCIAQCEKKEKTSKNIYVFYGKYKKDGKELNLIADIESENIKEVYYVYRDIETSKIYPVKYKKSKKFEKENRVIIPQYFLNTMDEINRKYELIRFNYYKNLLVDSQKSSYKLLKKNNE